MAHEDTKTVIPPGATVTSTALSLITCTAGAGVLSFPWAVAQAGILPVVIFTVLFSLLAGYCNLILAEFAYHYRRCMSSRTYDELIFLTLGPSHYTAVSAQVIFGLLGSLVGFFCVAADLGVPVAQHACLGTSSLFCTVFTSRGGVILFFATLVVLPLSSVSKVHHLRLPAALAVASVVFVVGLVVVRGFQGGSDGLPSPDLLGSSPGGVLLAFPIAIYSLGNHVQSVSIFTDIAPSNQHRYHLSVAACYITVVLLYCFTGVCGAWAFGGVEGVNGNILTNFALGDTPADVAKAIMAVHVALVIAVDAIPMRRSMTLALGRCKRGGSGGSGGVGGGGGKSSGGGTWEEVEATAKAALEAEAALPTVWGIPYSPSIAAQTLGILGASGGLAIFFPQVNVVFGLLGSTLGVSCLCGYPGLMLLQRAREVAFEEENRGGEDTSGSAAVRPLLAGGINGEGGMEGGGGDDKVGGDALPSSLGYIPTSSYWLRVQGWGLVGVSAVIAVACTWQYVKITF